MSECIKGLISIIIPVYKTEKSYLDRCIASIKEQSYEAYEVILVDDGNEAVYAEGLDGYSVLDERVKVVHKLNGGASSARNAGIDAAKGDYIVFVDSDDRINEGFLKSAVSYMEKYNLDIVFGGYQVEEAERIPDCDNIKIYDKEKMAHIKEFFFSGFATGDTKELRNCLGLVAPWAKMFKRCAIGNVRFDEDLILSEDNLFNLYCLDNAKCVGVVPECWYLYSVVENSICHTYRKNALQEINNSTKAFKEYLKKGNPEFIERENAFRHRMVKQLSSLLQYYYCNEKFDGKKPIKNIRKFLKDNNYKGINSKSDYILTKGYRIIRTLSKCNSATGLYVYRSLKR